MEAEIATQAVGLGGETDFSLIKLFIWADFVVKSVIVVLIAASIFSWALIVDKYNLFRKIIYPLLKALPTRRTPVTTKHDILESKCLIKKYKGKEINTRKHTIRLFWRRDWFTWNR